MPLVAEHRYCNRPRRSGSWLLTTFINYLKICRISFQGTMVPGLLYFFCAVAGFVSMALLIAVPETKDKDLRDLIVTVPIEEETRT